MYFVFWILYFWFLYYFKSLCFYLLSFILFYCFICQPLYFWNRLNVWFNYLICFILLALYSSTYHFFILSYFIILSLISTNCSQRNLFYRRFSYSILFRKYLNTFLKTSSAIFYCCFCIANSCNWFILYLVLFTNYY